MPYTREQKKIIRDINASKNVRVIAVAGSGKTSTILGTISNHKSTLVLCYNTRLREETNDRIILEEDAPAFDVHTFHSFVRSVFDEELATTDMGIVKVNAFLDKLETFTELPPQAYSCLVGRNRYRRIIIDEAQDLTPEYYTLAKHLLKLTRASLTLLGDPRQAIYQFNGASDKYLLEAETFFARDFVDRTLSKSFRVPGNIATLINAACGEGQDIVASVPKGIKPMIYFESLYEKMDIIIDMIKKVPPGDVLVLMYSTRRDSYRPSIHFANAIIDAGIPVSFNGIPSSRVPVDDSVLMISYHQSKGLERPIVICLDMGEYYFTLNPDVSSDNLPNLWYVAMTRASKFLIAFIDQPFEFITRGLQAIGFNPPQSITSTVSARRENDDTIDGYISRGFDRLIKYAPTSIQVQLMDRRKYPETFSSFGFCGMTAGDAAREIICEYTRKRLTTDITAQSFYEEYRDTYLGGLRGVMMKVGKIMLGAEKISLIDALDRGYEVAKHACNGLTGIIPIRGEYGNNEAVANDGTVIIINSGPTIDARMRVASFPSQRVMIINVIDGSMAILLAKDHTIE